MNEINLFIQNNGDLCYLIVFLWTALEGETFVIFVSLAAQKGLLNVWLLFLAAWSGTFLGDQLLFLAGRRYGERILNRFPKLKKPVDLCLQWLERHAPAFILSYRFIYGIRNVSSFAIGMSHLPWKKFLFWNAIAAGVWAASFTGFGYFYGAFIDHVRPEPDTLFAGVRQFMLSALGLFILIVGFRALVVKLHRKNMKGLLRSKAVQSILPKTVKK